MAKTKISDFNSNPALNTDIDSINISEGCAPSGINDAIRELMSQLKDFQTGAVGDSFNGPIGSSTAATGAFTTVTATSAASINSESRSVIKLADTSSVAQGNGGGLLFRGVYTGTTLVDAAGVQAYKANATDNDYSYGLAFVTRANGGNLTANMKLDQSGNLGLGVTPSAWNSSYKALQIGSTGALYSVGTAALANNFYVDSGSTNKYITSSFATAYIQNSSGQHAWYNAPSGTAGNAITFTQAMTLDASGNLGVGTTSPAFKLDVNGVGYFRDLLYVSGSQGISSDGASPLLLKINNVERARITSGGILGVGITNPSGSTGDAQGVQLTPTYVVINRNGGTPLIINRKTDDGTLVSIQQDNNEEGTISVSGTTVSYNGGHLSRWAQTTSAKDDSLLKGTVLSNLDAMNVYTDAEGNPVDNEQLNKVKVSDVEGDANVAGVFVNWTHDEQHNVDEINMAMTGDMIIRIAQGTTVQRGDLLMSAGNGTAKPQGDDIVRSKTIAKVTSNHVTCTYADGSYCVPCVLMAC